MYSQHGRVSTLIQADAHNIQKNQSSNKKSTKRTKSTKNYKRLKSSTKPFRLSCFQPCAGWNQSSRLFDLSALLYESKLWDYRVMEVCVSECECVRPLDDDWHSAHPHHWCVVSIDGIQLFSSAESLQLRRGDNDAPVPWTKRFRRVQDDISQTARSCFI